MLYFAYGSNLNLRQMRHRCPKAVPLRRFFLSDARLVFRGVADVISEPGSTCPGGLWKITPECERALDRYEGFNPQDQEHGLYRKSIVEITGMPGETELMMYQMNSTGIMPPSEGYLEGIRQGYRDFKLLTAPLEAAVAHSWEAKNKTIAERARRYRSGYPQLAKAVSNPSKTGKADTGKKSVKKRSK